MQIGIGTIYLILILLKVFEVITMGWFAVLTSIIWLPLLVFAGYMLCVGVFFGAVFLLALIIDR